MRRVIIESPYAGDIERNVSYASQEPGAPKCHALSYVGGDNYTLAPDGSYVGGDNYTLTPDGSYVGSGGNWYNGIRWVLSTESDAV